MYTGAYDRERGLLFGLWSGPANTDDDFERAAADVLLLDREGEDQPEGVLHVAETDPDNPVPTPAQRRRLSGAAEVISHARVYYFCMVTRSALVRGVITALGWFASSRGHRLNGCRATFEEAVTWAEGHRPGVGARLRELRQEARQTASLASPGRTG